MLPLRSVHGLAISAAIGFVATSSGARTPPDAALVVSYSASASVVLHQPIIVNFDLHNGTPEPVRLDLGLGTTRNFIVRVVRPDGVVVAAPRVPVLKEGPIATGKHTIPAFGDFSQELILDQWFAFDRVGSYRIEIDLASRMMNQSGVPIDAATDGSVTLQVGPRNDGVLNAICQELASRIRNATAIGSRYAAAAQLAHVYDALAVPYVREILDETDTVDHFLFPGLVRLGTPEARAILGEMARSPDEARASQAAAALSLR